LFFGRKSGAWLQHSDQSPPFAVGFAFFNLFPVEAKAREGCLRRRVPVGPYKRSRGREHPGVSPRVWPAAVGVSRGVCGQISEVDVRAKGGEFPKVIFRALKASLKPFQ